MDTTQSSVTVTPVPVVLEPKVTLLAHTMIHDDQLLTDVYEDHPCYNEGERFPSEGEALIEFAGRECYQSFHNPIGRTNSEYIGNILKQQHYSVLEHTNVTFRIEDVSRRFTHELVRHRHFSYSQLSQRYVNQIENPAVAPPFVQDDPTLMVEYVRLMDRFRIDLAHFQKLVDNRHPDVPKKKKQEAIAYLAPGGWTTKIVVTGNLRAWLEFLPKRTSPGADAEMQAVAKEIENLLKREYPAVFDAS